MAKADGTIVIDTKILDTEFKAGSKEVEASLKRIAARCDKLSESAKLSLQKQINSFTALNDQYAKQEAKVEALRQKVKELGEQKVPTEEYKNLESELSTAYEELDKLVAKQKEYEDLGFSEDAMPQSFLEQLDAAGLKVGELEEKLDEMKASGKAYKVQVDTAEAQAAMERLKEEERKLDLMNDKLWVSYKGIDNVLVKASSDTGKMTKEEKKAAAAAKNVDAATRSMNKALKDTSKKTSGAGTSLKKMIAIGLGIQSLFALVQKLKSYLTEGFENLAQYSDETNNSISGLMSSLSTLKNNLAVAFAPIVNTVAPILTSLINMLSQATEYVNMFFAALQGKSTYTKAVAVQEDYAASLSDTATATDDAAEATESYLSPLDELNKVSDSSTSSSGTDSDDTSGSEILFTEESIDSGVYATLETILSKFGEIKQKAAEVKNLFASGFWDGLGDYAPVLSELKSDLSSIGSYIRDIFTDTDVQAAASEFVSSFVYNVGKISGSFASIGLTIGALTVGGAESYLGENSDRIKTQLINMFDVGTEIMTKLGTLVSDIAEIFRDVFGSQTAQDLLGDLIGIFTETFMLVTTLAANFANDVLNLIVTPINDNKEKIKTALMETLEPLEQMLQSIEDLFQSVSDKILEVYDEHIKPFMDSLADGISTIVSDLLDAYNTYIAPVLDSLADKFDEVINGPVSDCIDSFLDLIGSVADALKAIWENILQPLISWIISNIIPVIAPIIETVGSVFLDLVGVITGVASGILDAIGGVVDFFTGVFTGDIDKAVSGVKKIWEGLQKACSSVFNGIVSVVGTVVSGVVSFFTNLINAAVSLKNSVVNAITTLKDNVVTVFSALTGKVSDAFTEIKTTITGAVNIVKNTVVNTFNNIKTTVIDIVETIVAKVKPVIKKLKTIFSNVFNALIDIVKTPINTIIGFLNSFISGIASIVNTIANMLNGISIDVPQWVTDLTGVTSFGFNLPTWTVTPIPYLASGAVIPPNSEFMAVLGDQKSGNNIEAPESLLRQIVREESGGNGSSSYRFTAQLNRRTLFDEVITEAKLRQSQNGRNPFELA